jgi:hypothetical protein
MNCLNCISQKPVTSHLVMGIFPSPNAKSFFETFLHIGEGNTDTWQLRGAKVRNGDLNHWIHAGSHRASGFSMIISKSHHYDLLWIFCNHGFSKHPQTYLPEKMEPGLPLPTQCRETPVLRLEHIRWVTTLVESVLETLGTSLVHLVTRRPRPPLVAQSRSLPCAPAANKSRKFRS